MIIIILIVSCPDHISTALDVYHYVQKRNSVHIIKPRCMCKGYCSCLCVCVCVCVCVFQGERVENGVCPLSIEWRLNAQILF